MMYKAATYRLLGVSHVTPHDLPQVQAVLSEQNAASVIQDLNAAGFRELSAKNESSEINFLILWG